MLFPAVSPVSVGFSKSGALIKEMLFPVIVNSELSLSPVPETKVYIWVFPASESVVEKVPTEVVFSGMVLLDNSNAVGALLSVKSIPIPDEALMALFTSAAAVDVKAASVKVNSKLAAKGNKR